MSGTVSRVLNVAGGLNQLAGLVSGSGPIVLGDFVFDTFAVPETVDYGGSQAMAVHKLPGGARIIDAMGDDRRDLAWSGIFLGPNAEDDARQIDEMMVAGQAVPLTWGGYNYSVVISQFSPKWGYARVAYSITCVILSDDSGANDDDVLADLLGDDTASAIENATAAVQPALAVAQTAVTALSNFGIVSPSLGNVVGQLNAAGAVATGAVSAAASSLNLIGSGATMLRGIGDASTAVTATGSMAGNVIAGGYVARAAKNAATGIG